jgi:5-methylcytosine-specific restriction protein B
VGGIDLGKLLARLNERISALLDRDHEIGHSYFFGVTDDAGGPDKLHFLWYRRVVPLLQEYFYNDGERLRAVLGSDFVRPIQLSAETCKSLGDVFDPDVPKYEVVVLSGEGFLNALRGLAGSTPQPATS